MFKNLIIYRLDSAAGDSPEGVEEALEAHAFAPCGPTQSASHGWISPRAESGPLAERIAGQEILKLQTETKVLPADAVKRKLAERCKLIEETTGRKPGKKQTKELKEEVFLELLPTALTRRSATLVWIDWSAKLLMVDATSAARADDVVTLLVRAFDGLAVAPATTHEDPITAMSQWLIDGEAPLDLSIDRECELKALDETKAVVRYGNHSLDIEEVRAHILAGKVPTRLALTWRGRVSFQLTEGLALRKIKLLDAVMVGDKDTEVDAFDGNVAIATGELQMLFCDLFAGLDGLHDITLQE